MDFKIFQNLQFNMISIVSSVQCLDAIERAAMIEPNINSPNEIQKTELDGVDKESKAQHVTLRTHEDHNRRGKKFKLRCSFQN